MFVTVSIARLADVLAHDALTKLAIADDLYSGHEALFADDLDSDPEALWSCGLRRRAVLSFLLRASLRRRFLAVCYRFSSKTGRRSST